MPKHNNPAKGLRKDTNFPAPIAIPPTPIFPKAIFLLRELFEFSFVTSFGKESYIITIIYLSSFIILQKNSDSFSNGPSLDKTYFSILQYLSFSF